MNLSVTIALNLTIDFKNQKNIAILNLDKKISKFRFTFKNNGKIVSYDKKTER